MTGMVEFHIARLTAQSKTDPKNPSGGKPEISIEDIQAARGCLNWFEDVALMARTAQDRISSENLLGVAQAISTHEWRQYEKNYRTKITNERLDKIAQAAVLTFLSPFENPKAMVDQQVKRDDSWAAKWVGTTDQVWARDFRQHFGVVLGKILDHYISGHRKMRYFLSRKSSSEAQALDAA